MKKKDLRFVLLFVIHVFVLVFASCGDDGGDGGENDSNQPINPPSNQSTYGISLSETGTYTFTSVTQGYISQAPLTVVVNNTGNQSTGTLNVTLTGTNSGSFNLSNTTLPSINIGNNTSFTVVPKAGLAFGVYSATVTVSGGNGITAGFNINFTVINPNAINEQQNVPDDRIVYYWVNDERLITNTSNVTINAGETLTITAQDTGYTNRQWYLNGINTGQSGTNYSFSSTTLGNHIVGLFVQKDGKLYNTNITITVQ